MGNNPLFSIIIPVFNAEKYLEKCILSILTQTFPSFELIIVNDGSTDRSLEICEKFAMKDDRIRVFTQLNQGVSAARNRGIDLAIGKYITFIDSDDFVDSNYLDIFAGKISERDYDFVVAGVRHIDEKDDVLIEYKSESKEITTKEGIGKLIPLIELKSLLGGPVSKTFKKDLIEKSHISFNQDFHFGEDQIFNFQYLIVCGSMAVVNYIGYNYVQRTSDSLVKKKYSYEKTNKIADALYRIRIDTIKHFLIEDNDYKLLNERKYSLLKAAALLRIYQNEFRKSKAQRIICINESLSKIDISSLPFTSFHYRIVKKILKIRKVETIDFLLDIYTKLRSLLKI